MAEKQNILEVEDLKKVVKILSANWYWFVIFPCIASAVSYFYTHRLTDIYAAKTQILLKSDDTYTGGEGSRFTNIYSSYENTSSQIRVLKSSDLIEKAIAKMDIGVSYYIIGRVKISEIFGSMPFKVESENFGSSAVGKEFKINLVDTNKFRLTYSINDEEISKEYLFGDIILDYGFYFTISQSSNLNENSIAYLSKINYMFKINNRDNLVAKYKAGLAVKNLEWTSVMEASVEDEIPERAISFLDTLSSVFIENILQSKINISVNTLNYIDRQLDEVSVIIRDIEDEMERFKSSSDIVNLGREEAEAFKKLSELDVSKSLLEMKINSIHELREYVLKNTDEKVLPPAFLILEEDAFLKNSVNKLYDIQINKSDLLFKETEKSLTAKGMDSTFERVRKDALLYMLNLQNFLEKNMQELSAEISIYEEKVKNFPKTQRQIVNIERKLNINQSLYQFLLTKRAETVIARAGIISETKVIERARSIGVVRPDKEKISGTFLSFGFLLALVISLIRFFFFEKFDTIKDLSAITKLPILGGIPYRKEGNKNYVLIDDEPRSSVTEAFRTIRTNMQYLSPEKKSKVILVTSLHPEEGKTFCSSNLALIFAKANKKVLLVDLDLHRPKIHKTMNVNSAVGMSNFLIGKQTYEESKTLSVYENLDVVFSGPTPPNASELILSDNIPLFFEKARQEYDFIVIDTPPISLINDAVVLMSFVDIAVFVTNTKFVNKRATHFLEELVTKISIKSCGLVLNGIKSKRWKYYYGSYYYGYGYSYKYGYGYSYGNDSDGGSREKAGSG